MTSPPEFPDLNASLLKSGKYSDLTIICHGKTFNVHRAVVCTQSKVLAAAADGGFKEGKTGVIDLEQDEPEVVEKMLCYLYTHDYSDGVPLTHPFNFNALKNTTNIQSHSDSQRGGAQRGRGSIRGRGGGRGGPFNTPPRPFSPTAADSGALLLNAKLYVAGDIRDIPGLKTLAAKKYSAAVSTTWDISSLVSSLELIYQETREEDRLLKDIALLAASTHLERLLESEQFCVLCKKVGEIGLSLLKISKRKSSNRPEGGFGGVDRGCPDCGGQIIDNDLCADGTRNNYEHSINCWFA